MDLPFTESDPSSENKDVIHKDPEIQGGIAASCTVETWRAPRTVTSLSMIDGWLGRGYVTFKDGGIAQNVRDKVNSEYGRFIWVAPTQPTSHIWTESSLIHYLSFLADEIRLRRKQLGLDASAKALILLDQAGAHMSRSYLQLQQKWSAQHNIESWSKRF